MGKWGIEIDFEKRLCYNNIIHKKMASYAYLQVQFRLFGRYLC